MNSIIVEQIGKNVEKWVNVEQVQEGYRVTFPEGTQYRSERQDISFMQRWMTPDGAILTYTQLTVDVDFSKPNTSHLRPCMVVHEDPKSRADAQQRGWQNWKSVFGFR